MKVWIVVLTVLLLVIINIHYIKPITNENQYEEKLLYCSKLRSFSQRNYCRMETTRNYREHGGFKKY